MDRDVRLPIKIVLPREQEFLRVPEILATSIPEILPTLA
jgi:hypothetical protein